MSTQNCTYRSVVLKEGETFILPTGATVIGATNPDGFTSINDCVNTDNLETLQCYIAKVVLFDNGNNAGEFFEANPAYQNMIGFTFNDTFYSVSPTTPASSIYQPSATENIMKKMQDQIPAIVDYNGIYHDDGSNYNWMYIYQILTFPSIAENLFINLTADAENFSPGSTPYIVPFLPAADVDLGDAVLTSLCPES